MRDELKRTGFAVVVGSLLAAGCAEPASVEPEPEPGPPAAEVVAFGSALVRDDAAATLSTVLDVTVRNKGGTNLLVYGWCGMELERLEGGSWERVWGGSGCRSLPAPTTVPPRYQLRADVFVMANLVAPAATWSEPYAGTYRLKVHVVTEAGDTLPPEQRISREFTLGSMP